MDFNASPHKFKHQDLTRNEDKSRTAILRVSIFFVYKIVEVFGFEEVFHRFKRKGVWCSYLLEAVDVVAFVLVIEELGVVEVEIGWQD